MSQTDNITNVVTPTFTGTGAQAGATVSLFNTNGTALLGTGVANAAGNWTITSLALANGAHTLTTKQTVAGSTSSASASLVVTIDAAAPARPTRPDLIAASDSGASNTDNITSVTTPTFTGTAEAGSTVTLFDGTTKIGAAVATGGTWNITSSSLSNGVHAISATATDVAGNVSLATAALSVTVDTNTPSAPVFNAVSTARVAGTGDPGGMVTVRDGGTTLGATKVGPLGNWSWAFLTAPGNTVHVYTAFETDAAGNVGPVTAGTAQLGTTGADKLTSTAGNDFFRGAAGADTFSFAAGFGNDVIADFATAGAAHDIINFHAIATLNSFAAVLSHATLTAAGVVIAQDANDTLTLNNVTTASLTAADFKFV